MGLSLTPRVRRGSTWRRSAFRQRGDRMRLPIGQDRARSPEFANFTPGVLPAVGRDGEKAGMSRLKRFAGYGELAQDVNRSSTNMLALDPRNGLVDLQNHWLATIL